MIPATSRPLLLPIGDSLKGIEVKPKDIGDEVCPFTTETIRDMAKSSQRLPYLVAFTLDKGDSTNVYDYASLKNYIIHQIRERQPVLDSHSKKRILKISLFGLLNLNDNFKYICSFSPHSADGAVAEEWIFHQGYKNKNLCLPREIGAFEAFFETAAQSNLPDTHFKLALVCFSKEKYLKGMEALIEGINQKTICNYDHLFLHLFNFLSFLKQYPDNSLEPYLLSCLGALNHLIDQKKIDLDNPAHTAFVEMFFLTIIYKNVDMKCLENEGRWAEKLTFFTDKNLVCANFLMGYVKENTDPTEATNHFMKAISLYKKVPLLETEIHSSLFTANIPYRIHRIAKPGPEFEAFKTSLQEELELNNHNNYAHLALYAFILMHSSNRSDQAQAWGLLKQIIGIQNSEFAAFEYRLAHLMLAKMHEKGKGCQKNSKTAEEHYKSCDIKALKTFLDKPQEGRLPMLISIQNYMYRDLTS